MSAPGRVLVLGGTGFVGRSLCERLQRAGWTVRVPTRRLRHGQALQPLPTLELAQADVHDEAALRRLLAGCDAVVNLVAILHGSPAAFERVHVALPQRLAAAMAATGVRRLVHISALGVGPGAPSNYLRSKTAGEAALQAAGLDLTLIRPSVIFGADDRFLNVFARLQALAPVVPLAGSTARFQPVWVEDVAAAVVQALQQHAAIGQIYEAAGPGRLHAGRSDAAGRPLVGPRTAGAAAAGRAGPAAGRADGAGAGRAADVGRQPRLDEGAQRGQRHAARPGRAGHHTRGAGGGGTAVPGPTPRPPAVRRLPRPRPKGLK